MTDTAARYRLARKGELPLDFTGTLLADVSSEAPDKPAWTVHHIYRTETGRYVVATWRGKPSGLDMPYIVVVDTAEEIPAALRQERRGGLSYQTNVGLAAMEMAAKADPAVAAAVIERV